MGHSIASRTASQRSGRRSGTHQPSTDLRTLSTGMRRWVEAYHHCKAHGGRAPHPEGRVALGGGVRLEEMAGRTGQEGSP